MWVRTKEYDKAIAALVLKDYLGLFLLCLGCLILQFFYPGLEAVEGQG